MKFLCDDEGLMTPISFSENLKVKPAGTTMCLWQEGIKKAYTAELQAFAEDVAYNREPESGIDIALDNKDYVCRISSARADRRIEL